MKATDIPSDAPQTAYTAGSDSPCEPAAPRHADDLSALRQPSLAEARRRLDDLLAQRGRLFLLGAGCSKCAKLPLTSELTALVLKDAELGVTTRTILDELRSVFATAPASNIEDLLSELVDHLSLAGRREACGASPASALLGSSSYNVAALTTAAEEIKAAIVRSVGVPASLETHRRFAKAVHRPLRPSASRSDPAVGYLVLNYDTLLEDALALERIPFADGMDGGATGWWNPSTYDRRDLAARVYKLHGSLDWCEVPPDTLPRRISRNSEPAVESSRKVLIWPASTKHRETQLDPYAQLADHARQALRPDAQTQKVLISCGYAFGDSHINLEVERALRRANGNLTLVAFTSDAVPAHCLKAWIEDPSIGRDVLVFARRGFFHGADAVSVETDLPWWRFEVLTRLLEEER